MEKGKSPAVQRASKLLLLFFQFISGSWPEYNSASFSLKVVFVILPVVNLSATNPFIRVNINKHPTRLSIFSPTEETLSPALFKLSPVAAIFSKATEDSLACFSKAFSFCSVSTISRCRASYWPWVLSPFASSSSMPYQPMPRKERKKYSIFQVS